MKPAFATLEPETLTPAAGNGAAPASEDWMTAE